MSGGFDDRFGRVTRKPPPGHVSIYNADHARTLLSDAGKEMTSMGLGTGTRRSNRSPTRRRGGPGNNSKVSQSLLERQKEIEAQRKAKRYSDYLEAQEQRMKDSERNIKDSLERQAARREARFQRSMGAIEDPNSRGHIRSVNKMVELHDQVERRKQEHQYLDWKEGVFTKIQRNINDQLDALPEGHSNRRRRQAFQEFIDVTNNKGPIFRDIIIESEYDPLRPNRENITAKFKEELHDPTKRVLQKAKEEKNMVRLKREGKYVEPDGRETLDVLHWGTGKIESTPHGFFAKMTAQDPGQSRPSLQKLYASHVNFDHYRVQLGNEYSAAEFPLGKKVDFEQNRKPTTLQYDVDGGGGGGGGGGGASGGGGSGGEDGGGYESKMGGQE